ncbi:hypothetical protein [Caulobacter sp. UC70_42]|uniref:hypothetical protein n=1 Tax=Caulobacter sp. UC70_42 TaxID=3374551 RepID=UPI0037577A22
MPQAIPAIAAAFASTAAAVTAVTSTVVLGLTVGTWATIGATALSLGMAMSAAAEAKKAGKALESTGQQLQLKAAGDSAPVPFMLGRTATGGYLTYRDTYGSKNAELAMITVLSGGGPIAGIESYSAAEYDVGFGTNPNYGLATVSGTSPSSGLYAGKMRQRWLSGADSDGSPTNYSGIALPGLGSADKLTGLAHALMLCTYDTKVFPNGLPSKNLWVGSGLKHYDPRKDSTQPGGSGAHRWGQPSTYEFSENPGVVGLNWSLGIWSNGKRVGGIGASFDDIDLPAFVSMANVCDANGWKVGGVVTSDDSKFNVLNAILQAGGAVAAARGAQLSVIQNAPKASVYTLGADDIVGTVEINNTTGFRDRKNTIVPRYRAESQGWEVIAGETVTASTYVTEDAGETRSVEVQYALVQGAAQAHQLAAYDLVNTREFLTATVTCKPRLLNVRVGDCITTNVPDLGMNGRKMLVVGRSLDPASLQVTLNLRAETDAKHAFALGQSQTAPPSPALGGFDPSNPPAPANVAWAITGTTVTSISGVKEPAIVVTGACDDPNASSIIVEYRKVGETDWTAYSEYPTTTTRIEVTGVSAGQQYQVAISYRTVRDVVSSNKLVLGPVIPGDHVIPWTSNAITGRPDWMFASVWAPFQDIYVPQIVLDYGNTVTQVANDLAAVQANTSAALGAGYAKRDELREVANATNELAYAAIRNVLADAQEEVETKRLTFLDGEEIGTVVRNEQVRTDDTVSTLNLIGVKAANGTTFVLDTSKVQVGNGVSMASKFTALQSETANAVAQATQQFNTVAGNLAANASVLTSLGSTVANNNAAVTQQFATTANAIAAESSARLTLASTVANNASYANQQFATLTTADSAEANARVALASIVANNAAVATQQFNTVANAVAANASVLTALQSTVANNNSTATQQLSTLTNQQAATSSFLSKLGAEFNGNTAILLDRNKVYVDSSTSMASRDALIENRFNGSSSSYLLTTATSASTNASSAVNTLQQMGATLNNGSAFALDSTKVTVSGYGSLAQTVTSLQSQINDRVTGSQLSASVSSQVTAQTGPGSSIASQITSVSTTANSASSTASLALSSANGNGAQAVLAVTNTANGNKLTGIKINGSTSSTIDLMASSLRVVDASGANPTVPFAVISGVTYMDNVVARNIGAGTITADKIVGGAVTNLVVNEYVGQVYFSTSEMEHLSFSYFCEGGKISLDVYCEVGTSTSSPAGAVYRLYCDSSVYNAGAVYCTPSWGQLGSTTPVVVNPGYGSHTFRVTYQATPGSGSVRANRTYVRLTELKK